MKSSVEKFPFCIEGEVGAERESGNREGHQLNEMEVPLGAYVGVRQCPELHLFAGWGGAGAAFWTTLGFVPLRQKVPHSLIG